MRVLQKAFLGSKRYEDFWETVPWTDVFLPLLCLATSGMQIWCDTTRWTIYYLSTWGLYRFVYIVFFSLHFFSAATKAKTNKGPQKKKATKGGKSYGSSPRWRNINIEFGADLVGANE